MALVDLIIRYPNGSTSSIIVAKLGTNSEKGEFDIRQEIFSDPDTSQKKYENILEKWESGEKKLPMPVKTDYLDTVRCFKFKNIKSLSSYISEIIGWIITNRSDESKPLFSFEIKLYIACSFDIISKYNSNDISTVEQLDKILEKYMNILEGLIYYR